MPLTTQLIYMSAATQEFDPIELTALLIKSREKNESLGISGMLVYHEGSFLQILEGGEIAVDQLYERIGHDPRHSSCKLLLRSYIDRRSFGDWTMGFIDTKLHGPKTLPGFQDFFGKRFSPLTFSNDPSTAHKLLLGFRDGKWRQKVEH